MYIHQHLLDTISQVIMPNKALIIYGPRRTGKTTLLRKYLETKKDYLFVNGEDIDVQHFLSSQSIEKLRTFIGNKKLLVVDEAQVIPQIGLNLKLIVDHCPDVKVIATGSSSFDLANHVGEPLTGRKITLKMYPLSQIEIGVTENLSQTRAHLEDRLTYGSYPEVVLQTDRQQRKDYLLELVSAYLYKDIIALDGIKKPNKIMQILQLLAFQIGKEVSLSEIGQQIGLSKMTVERYLDLLEKTFVLVNISGFSRNLRKEITKQSRYYFYDVGIRNAIINQFNPITLRNDIGQIWENYIVMERLKKQAYQKIDANNYFWRTYDQQEIDWVEDREGKLHGYEIKWNESKKVKAPKTWHNTYDNASFQVIHKNNYLTFIT